jgi:hypothetical protein
LIDLFGGQFTLGDDLREGERYGVELGTGRTGRGRRVADVPHDRYHLLGSEPDVLQAARSLRKVFEGERGGLRELLQVLYVLSGGIRPAHEGFEADLGLLEPR